MKKLYTSLFSLIFVAALYSSAWFFMGYKINQAINQFYTQDAPANGITFLGEKPKLSGFPAVPFVTYTKGFKKGDLSVTFSKLRVIGFPIPTFPIAINIDHDLTIQDNKTKKSLTLDYLRTTLEIPKSFPRSSKKNDVLKWQKEVERIDIKHFKTAKENMKINATGFAGLDNNLQPTLNLDTDIKNHEELIQFFVKTGELKPLPAALALSALNAMAKTDLQTNEHAVNLKVKIQDQTLFLGPIRTIKLPPVYWR